MGFPQITPIIEKKGVELAIMIFFLTLKSVPEMSRNIFKAGMLYNKCLENYMWYYIDIVKMHLNKIMHFTDNFSLQLYTIYGGVTLVINNNLNFGDV